MKKNQLSNHPGHGFEMNHELKAALKRSLLLTTAIFLIAAPLPDSKDFANISANFIAPQSEMGSQAPMAGE